VADTEARTFTPSPNSIAFRTRGTWNADELSRFLTAVDEIYAAFLTVYLARQSQPNYEEQKARFFEHWMEWFYAEAERRYAAGRVDPYGVRFSTPSPASFYPPTDQESRYIAFVYDNIRTLAPHDRLVVEAVRMGSDDFSFLMGLGEPIAQLREFIKDLFYRNRQERERGDMEIEQQKELHRLEVARQHLQLHRDYGDLLSGPAGRVVLDTLEAASEVERLELEGKLVNVADNVDPETFDPDAG
jgi:hypothetical protein